MRETERRPIRLAIQSGRRMARGTLVNHLTSQADIEVVGHTGTLKGLHALCTLYRPDVCVVDVGSLTAVIVDQLQQLPGAFPGMDVVVTYADATTAVMGAAVRAGIAALVPESAGAETVLRVVRQRAVAIANPPVRVHLLTDRELAVVSLMGAGRSVAEMAELLRISPHTVENHKRSIYAKFGVGNQSHAVSRAISLGLFDMVDQAAAPGGTPEPVPDEPAPPEAGRSVLAVVRGPAGDCRDAVIVALLADGVPFVVSETDRPPAGEHWVQWHRGRLVSVLVDPDSDAWQFAREVAAPVVAVHSQAPEPSQAVDAVLHGAWALLAYVDIGVDLCSLVSLVARGYRALNAAHVRLLSNWVSGLIDRPSPGAPELTSRERDILSSIACGHTVRQTARALGIATKTVENTQARLFRKLGTRNRSETLITAYRMGLIAQ